MVEAYLKMASIAYSEARKKWEEEKNRILDQLHFVLQRGKRKQDFAFVKRIKAKQKKNKKDFGIINRDHGWNEIKKPRNRISRKFFEIKIIKTLKFRTFEIVI